MRSDPIEMLKYTMQGLSYEGHLEIYYKNIYIHKNERHKRARAFVRLGQKYDASNPYSSAEKFVLSIFDKPELRLHEIKNAVLEKLNDDIKNFKSEYVYADVSAKKLCWSRSFLNWKGRKERKLCELLMDDVDKNVDELLRNKNALNDRLEALDANVIFLKESTLTKFGKKIYKLDELNRFFEPIPGTGSSVSYGGSFYGGGSSGGSGGWGGYGGGSFGGGGSGGGW